MDKSEEYGFRCAFEPAQLAPRAGVMSSVAEQPQRLALPALLAGGIAIGFSPIFVRLSELGPVATGFHRLFLALPLLWLWMHWEARVAREATKVEWLPMAVPGALFAGDIFFWHWSITYTTVANATLFANLAPVIVTFGAWFYLREHISFRFLVGMALAMGGAALLVNASAALGTRSVLGDVLGLVTACFFGSYVVAVARLRGRYAASTIMFYSSAVTCVLLLAATLVSGEGLVQHREWLDRAIGLGVDKPGDGARPHRLRARPSSGFLLRLGDLDRATHGSDIGLGLARRGVGRAASRRRRHCARWNHRGAPGEWADGSVKGPAANREHGC